MRFGLSDSEYAFISKTVVVPLADRGASVWCFGSRARGTHARFSDLDLMVDCPDNLEGFISEISEQLIESDFPYKVDLVELRRFAKSYLEGFFRERVLWEVDSQNTCGALG
jgi:predicted nucleotidyltransferase